MSDQAFPSTRSDAQQQLQVEKQGTDNYLVLDNSGKRLCRRGWFIWGIIAIILILLPVIGAIITITKITAITAMVGGGIAAAANQQ